MSYIETTATGFLGNAKSIACKTTAGVSKHFLAFTTVQNYIITNYGFDRYAVMADDGVSFLYLRNRHGDIRVFSTRNSARKRIARERAGNFHN